MGLGLGLGLGFGHLLLRPEQQALLGGEVALADLRHGVAQDEAPHHAEDQGDVALVDVLGRVARLDPDGGVERVDVLERDVQVLDLLELARLARGGAAWRSGAWRGAACAALRCAGGGALRCTRTGVL